MRVKLNAVIVALGETNPMVLRIAGSDDVVADALPGGEFDPENQPTLGSALRHHVKIQTGMMPRHIEQLSTFGNLTRQNETNEVKGHTISVGYLVATPFTDPFSPPEGTPKASWKSLYSFFPWEDWRKGRPEILDNIIIPALNKWRNNAGAYSHDETGLSSDSQIKQAFGLGSKKWDETQALKRYELIYDAGLVEESVRDGKYKERQIQDHLGSAMRYDHRRMLATAIVRLRQKLQRHLTLPEFLPDVFTLTQLQNSVEKFRGIELHKQNFRRQIDNEELVVQTNEFTKGTGGRPAALYQFRAE